MSEQEIEGLSKREKFKKLVKLLDNRDVNKRLISIKALEINGSNKSVRRLIKCLKDREPNIRRQAVLSLGIIGSPLANSPLIKSLKDYDGWVQAYSAESLGKIGSKKAVPHLLRKLQDEHHQIRKAAADALAKISDEKSIPELLDLFALNQFGTSESAADILKKIGPLSVIPLIKFIEAQHWDWSKRREATELLERIRKNSLESGNNFSQGKPEQFALAHINPAINPKAYMRLYEEILKRKKKTDKQWELTAKQLMALEGKLK